MPKNRVTKKSNTGAVSHFRPSTKLRIGTRKSGKSAFLMSTEDLVKVIEDKNKTRYHAKAKTVLSLRGAPYVAPTETATAEAVEG